MGVFSEVKITWKGEDYVVPPERVMRLIATIEDVVTIEELMTPRLKRGKIAEAYGAALRFAGAKVHDEEVYTTLFGAEAMVSTLAAIDGLMKMIIPPEHLQPKTEEKPKGNAGGKKSRKGSKSSTTSARS